MKKPISSLLQLGYWILYAILLTVLFFVLTIFQRPPINFVYWWRIMLGFAVIPAAISFYASYTLLFSGYQRTGKGLALLLQFIFAIVVATITGMMVLTILTSANYLTNDGMHGAFSLATPIAFLASVNGCIGFVIKGFESWFGDIKLKEELTRKNYEMELALVKSQLDPHFLFNTINNIDILIETDSTKASGYLNKLSDIMRFLLYETKTNWIPLSKELDYIGQYIALQKIRTSNENAINYILVGHPGKKMIAPMLFIPFIENAFKHSNLKVDGAVDVKFVVKETTIIFTCENQFIAHQDREKQMGGLGKELVERRLSLLYPGKYDLDIKVEQSCYRIKLVIEE